MIGEASGSHGNGRRGLILASVLAALTEGLAILALILEKLGLI